MPALEHNKNFRVESQIQKVECVSAPACRRNTSVPRESRTARKLQSDLCFRVPAGNTASTLNQLSKLACPWGVDRGGHLRDFAAVTATVVHNVVVSVSVTRRLALFFEEIGGCAKIERGVPPSPPLSDGVGIEYVVPSDGIAACGRRLGRGVLTPDSRAADWRNLSSCFRNHVLQPEPNPLRAL